MADALPTRLFLENVVIETETGLSDPRRRSYYPTGWLPRFRRAASSHPLVTLAYEQSQWLTMNLVTIN